MERAHEQLMAATPWLQDLGSSFPQAPFGLSQKLDGLFHSDVFDDVINSRPDFYLGDDFAHLLNTSSHTPNEFAPSPASSSSSFSDIGSNGPNDDGARSVGRLPQNGRKMVALAPAQPKSPSSGELQPPKGSRYHKRREQNRAAQRAFRMRKEQHVKDLEVKVVALEATQEKLSAENVRLQQDLNKATVENTILRSLTTPSGPRENGTSTSAQGGLDGEAERLAFMNTPAIPNFDSRHLPSATAQSNVRGGVLKGSKIWEFIIGHPLFQEGLIDVNMVAQQVQKYPRRDNGGCIAEAVLIECIEKSVKT